MFKANLNDMARAKSELDKSYRELDICLGELDSIRAALGRFSYMNDTVRQLGKKNEELKTQNGKVKFVVSTLEDIQRCYLAADRNAENYCEDRCSERWRLS